MKDNFDIPVALVFFTRLDTFKKVFEEVKKVKPSKLFLIQDGPRYSHPEDAEKINECRKIAENIDWECEVFKNYSETNLGCGKRPATGITWVFEHVDKAIILEDDCIPSESFFPYCKEMLERYEDDKRVAYISGLNHAEKWETENSYIFTKTGAIWGWATWKRAWDNYNYDTTLINNNELCDILADSFDTSRVATKKIATWKETNKKLSENQSLSYWDHQWGLVKYIQNQCVIVPKYNLISNIGTGETSTHALREKSLYVKGKNFVHMPIYELEFPLIHPKHMLIEKKYDDFVNAIIYPGYFKNLMNKIKFKLGI